MCVYWLLECWWKLRTILEPRIWEPGVAVVAGETGLRILATAQTCKLNSKWSEKEKYPFFMQKTKIVYFWVQMLARVVGDGNLNERLLL